MNFIFYNISERIFITDTLDSLFQLPFFPPSNWKNWNAKKKKQQKTVFWTPLQHNKFYYLDAPIGD